MFFKQFHWLEVAEFLALGGAVICLFTAMATQDLRLLLVFLTLGLILNSLNGLRWRYISQKRVTKMIKQVKEQISQEIKKIEVQVPVSPPPPPSEGTEGRVIARLKENLVSIEQSLNSVVQYLNTQVLPERIEQLEKSYIQLSQELKAITRQIHEPSQDLPPTPESEISPLGPYSASGLNFSQVTTQLPIVAPTSFVSQSPSIPVWNRRYQLIGHDDAVSSIAISPDGKWLISGSWDQTLRSWKLATGEAKSQIVAHSQGLLAVVFAPLEGSSSRYHIVTGSFDHTIKLWVGDHVDQESITLCLQATLTQHTGSVQSLAISSDPFLLISGSYDQTVKQWQLWGGELQCSSYDPLGAIYAIAVYAPEGLIASAGGDGRVNLWKLKTGEQIGFLAGNVSSVESLAFSPDGQTLGAGCVDGTIKLWQLDVSRFSTGRPLEPVRTLNAHSGQVKALVFSEQEQILFSGGTDGYLRIWHPNRREAIGFLTISDEDDSRHSAILSLALSSDGQTLIAGGADGIIQVWNKVS